MVDQLDRIFMIISLTFVNGVIILSWTSWSKLVELYSNILAAGDVEVYSDESDGTSGSVELYVFEVECLIQIKLVGVDHQYVFTR